MFLFFGFFFEGKGFGSKLSLKDIWCLNQPAELLSRCLTMGTLRGFYTGRGYLVVNNPFIKTNRQSFSGFVVFGSFFLRGWWFYSKALLEGISLRDIWCLKPNWDTHFKVSKNGMVSKPAKRAKSWWFVLSQTDTKWKLVNPVLLGGSYKQIVFLMKGESGIPTTKQLKSWKVWLFPLNRMFVWSLGDLLLMLG